MKKSSRIWITRSISEDSPLHSISREGHLLIDKSLIDLRPIALDNIPDCDVYFYYSKNCVRHAIANADRLNFPIQDRLHACIGLQTAYALIENDCRHIIYIGNSHGEIIAQDLDNYFSDLSFGFFTAQHSLNSVEKHLQIVDHQNIAVYNNTPLSQEIDEEIDFLIATSPMNAKTFFKNYRGKIKAVIAIGNTTAHKLATVYDGDILVASHPNEESLLDSLRSLF